VILLSWRSARPTPERRQLRDGRAEPPRKANHKCARQDFTRGSASSSLARKDRPAAAASAAHAARFPWPTASPKNELFQRLCQVLRYCSLASEHVPLPSSGHLSAAPPLVQQLLRRRFLSAYTCAALSSRFLILLHVSAAAASRLPRLCVAPTVRASRSAIPPSAVRKQRPQNQVRKREQ